MPIVKIDISEGRTIEQKRILVSKVTEAVAESLKVSSKNVQIVIYEFKSENYSKDGRLKIDR